MYERYEEEIPKIRKEMGVQTENNMQFVIGRNGSVNVSYRYEENRTPVCIISYLVNPLVNPGEKAQEKQDIKHSKSQESALMDDQTPKYQSNQTQSMKKDKNLNQPNFKSSSKEISSLSQLKKDSSIASQRQLRDSVPEMQSKHISPIQMDNNEMMDVIKDTSDKISLSEGLSQSLAIDDQKNSLRYKLNAYESQRNSICMGNSQILPFQKQKLKHRINRSDTSPLNTIPQIYPSRRIHQSQNPTELIVSVLQNIKQLHEKQLLLGAKKKTEESFSQINKTRHESDHKQPDYQQKSQQLGVPCKQQVLEHTFIIETSRIKMKKKALENLQWLHKI